MTFIDDDRVDQANSFKSIMMKECFPQRQRGSLPEKKCLCVRWVTHYCTIGACNNCTHGSYEVSLTVACRLGDAFKEMER